MNINIRLKRGTTAQWAASNPILADGEPGFDTTSRTFKIGDGVTHWTSLTPQTLSADQVVAVVAAAAAANSAADAAAIAVASVNRGGANGIAPLGADSKVPLTNLPALITQTAFDTYVAANPSATQATVAGYVSAAGSTQTALDGRFAKKADLWANVKDYGATGDGVTDDSAAITAAWASNRMLYFPAGNYYYNGAALATPKTTFFLKGESSERSIITFGPSATYLIDSPATGGTAWSTLYIADLTFSGGYGAIRNQRAVANVSRHKIIERCIFTGYSKCAVSSESPDEPYWDITNNRFTASAGSETFTIGVALAGSADDCVIENNSFLRNRIDLKLRRSMTAKIVNNDFVPYGVGDATNGRCAIWLVPGASVYGTYIAGNKFGNENITSLDYHILVADEDVSGSLVGDRFPILSADSTGSISGGQVIGNEFQGATGAAPPMVYSTASDMRGWIIGPLTLTGSVPTYIVQHRTPGTASRYTQSSVVGPIGGDSGSGVDGLPPLVCNTPGWATLNDLGRKMPDPQTPTPFPAGDSAGYVKLLATKLTAFSVSNCTKTDITDAMGGTDAVEVTYTSSGLFYAGLTLASIVAGQPAWLEFDVAPGTTSPLARILLGVQYGSAGVLHFRRYVPTTAAGWSRQRFLFVPRENASAMRFQFAAAEAGSVKLGRARAYHAHEPVAERLMLPDVTTTTTAPSAGGGGALPATPVGYMSVQINGTTRQVPYY